MLPALREALSRIASRAVGSPFWKPIARAALAGMGLVLLAVIGRTAVAGAGASSPAGVPSPSAATAPAQAGTAAIAASAAASGTPPTAPAASEMASGASTPVAPTHGTQASADDPVVLNTANVDDLRRLPGVGEKRALAILALRAQLGRFRLVEDLLKVKGIGRATLKRLRPLVRLDAPLSRDAGAAAPR